MFTSLLAQSSSSGGDFLGALGALFCCCGFILILVLPMMIGLYKTFAKAGQPGWAAFVPIYNIFIWMKIIGQEPIPRVIFHLIPFVNIYFGIVDWIALARCFGKDTGFAIGLIFLPFVFIPILGFGSAQYTPPGGMGGGYAPPPRPGMPPRR
jgi:hypothetical protein